MKGYIKLYRSIIDCDEIKEKPYCKQMAFVDLLLQANFAPRSWMGEEVKTGQLVTSYAKLGERWGWHRSKVRRYLDRLNRAKMATTLRHSTALLVELPNFAKLQGITIPSDMVPEQGSLETGQHNKNKNNYILSLSKDITRVHMREDVAKKLIAEDGLQAFLERVQSIDDYCVNKPRRYKDYAAAYRSWRRREKSQQSKTQQKPAYEKPKTSFEKAMELVERTKREEAENDFRRNGNATGLHGRNLAEA